MLTPKFVLQNSMEYRQCLSASASEADYDEIRRWGGFLFYDVVLKKFGQPSPMHDDILCYSEDMTLTKVVHSSGKDIENWEDMNFCIIWERMRNVPFDMPGNTNDVDNGVNDSCIRVTKNTLQLRVPPKGAIDQVLRDRDGQIVLFKGSEWQFNRREFEEFDGVSWGGPPMDSSHSFLIAFDTIRKEIRVVDPNGCHIHADIHDRVGKLFSGYFTAWSDYHYVPMMTYENDINGRVTDWRKDKFGFCAPLTFLLAYMIMTVKKPIEDIVDFVQHMKPEVAWEEIKLVSSDFAQLC